MKDLCDWVSDMQEGICDDFDDPRYEHPFLEGCHSVIDLDDPYWRMSIDEMQELIDQKFKELGCG